MVAGKQEAPPTSGEEMLNMRRKRVTAKLNPNVPNVSPRLPDFLARLKEIYKNKPFKVTGAELVAQDRGRY